MWMSFAPDAILTCSLLRRGKPCLVREGSSYLSWQEERESLSSDQRDSDDRVFVIIRMLDQNPLGRQGMLFLRIFR